MFGLQFPFTVVFWACEAFFAGSGASNHIVSLENVVSAKNKFDNGKQGPLPQALDLKYQRASSKILKLPISSSKLDQQLS